MGGTTGGPKDLPSSPASGFVPIHDGPGFFGDLPQPAALTSKNAITPPLPLGLSDGIGPGQANLPDDVQKATLLIRARESAAGRSLDTLEHGKLFDQVHQDLLRLDAFRTQRRKLNQLLGGAAVTQGRGKGLRSKTSFKSGISGAASDAAGGVGQAGANHKTPEDDEK